MLPDSAAIEPLLAERDALQGWLLRLEQSGNATPEAVRTKVRADYQRRLEGITERLRDHADSIVASLAEDRAEHTEFLDQLAIAEAGLAEAELRHAVGEYDGRRFEEEQALYGEEIIRCQQGLDAAMERIERMESVHALVTQPVVSADSLAPAPIEYSMAQPTLLDVAPVPKPVSEERFEDALLSVFDEPKDRGEPSSDFAPLSFRPGSGMPHDPPRPIEPRRFTPSHDTPPLGVPQDALPRFSRQPVATPPPASTEPPRQSTAPAIVSADDALFGGETIVAAGSDVSLPASRTLRCGECGAMNKPLEWYCEKCGAELTAA